MLAATPTLPASQGSASPPPSAAEAKSAMKMTNFSIAAIMNNKDQDSNAARRSSLLERPIPMKFDPFSPLGKILKSQISSQTFSMFKIGQKINLFLFISARLPSPAAISTKDLLERRYLAAAAAAAAAAASSPQAAPAPPPLTVAPAPTPPVRRRPTPSPAPPTHDGDEEVDVEQCSDNENADKNRNGKKEKEEPPKKKKKEDKPKIMKPKCNCEELLSVDCYLETKELWDKFNELGTEMIITKTGR